MRARVPCCKFPRGRIAPEGEHGGSCFLGFAARAVSGPNGYNYYVNVLSGEVTRVST